MSLLFAPFSVLGNIYNTELLLVMFNQIQRDLAPQSWLHGEVRNSVFIDSQ